MTESASEVLRRWIDAWAAGDQGRAATLLAPDAMLHTMLPSETAGEHVGFEALLAWYGDKRARMSQSGYRIREVLATRQHAVAIFVLSGSPHGAPVEWEQVAVYRVHDGRIVEIWLHEDEP